MQLPKRNKWFNFLAVATILATNLEHNVSNSLKTMEVAYEWGKFTYVYENSTQKEQLEANGELIEGNSVPFDVEKETVGRKRVFLSMPNLIPGSAVALSTVENITQRYNPRLQPYPNWNWHANNSGCDGLTSVYRTAADNCGRLWVVDSGDDLSMGVPQSLCTAQLVVFNLTTDEVIIRQRFESTGTARTSLLINVITESMDESCSDDVYAYIADANAFQLIVYHLRTQRFWRVPGNLFFPEVTAQSFVVNGVTFAKMTGVLGLALSPCYDTECDRFLFFHSFSGFIEGQIRTSILRNESLFLDGNGIAGNDADIIGRRLLQSVAQAMSREGYLFFGFLGANTLNCWNFRLPYNNNNFHVVEYDSEKISVQIGVKVKTYQNGEEDVWLISNNVQYVFSGDTTPNTTYPIYVMRGNVKDLVRGTGCEGTQ